VKTVLKFSKPVLLAAAFAASIALSVPPASAAVTEVAPGRGELAHAIMEAAAGDVLKLKRGTHDGPVLIDKALTIEGEVGAVVDGHGVGRTIEITAPGVSIRHLRITGSGTALDQMHAGVFLSETASGGTVEDNVIEDNLVGVYVHGAHDALVRRNRIAGRVLPHINDCGNGVYLWNAPGTKVEDNDITGGRDGIFTNGSRNNVFARNRIHGVRFAIHYMYTNDSEVSDNISIGNHAGYAIMYSARLKIRNNVSDDDRDHGLLFNFANDSDISGNAVRGSEKCLFIYNANKNTFHGNWFEGCRIGIHFTAGSEGNAMSGNAFIGNQTQVMYVGTRFLNWSERGRGNYWSDNPAFDLNGDGIADEAYRPNNIIDQIIWRYPAAKLLLNSPATQVVRWAQSQFPGLHPGGVVDKAPLMKPPVIKAAIALSAAPKLPSGEWR
jgi:nitrous oxidase accessory protein